jgi:ubiquinone/menaquinone biosynthesis C-methylase UbiE
VSTDELREALRAMWASVAGSWEEHAAFVDERGAAATERMLELAAPAPGDRVLELACGPGGTGLAAAARVEPGGEVVMSDVAAEMTAVAAARARALGLENVSTRELDLESIDEPDDSYDVVLCREGLMLVPEPGTAAAEIGRVLAPGGRFALAVWGPRERNPWLGVLFDAVSAQIGAPIPPPGRPGPFALSDADALAALLSRAGLSGVAVDEVPVPMRVASFEEWWSVVPALAGPLGKVLAGLPGDAREAIRGNAEASLRAHRTPEGLDIPGVSLVASGGAQ